MSCTATGAAGTAAAVAGAAGSTGAAADGSALSASAPGVDHAARHAAVTRKAEMRIASSRNLKIGIGNLRCSRGRPQVAETAAATGKAELRGPGTRRPAA